MDRRGDVTGSAPRGRVYRTRRSVQDNFVPFICILSPVICFILDKFQKNIFGNFEIGLELLIINGLLTFTGLMLISKKAEPLN